MFLLHRRWRGTSQQEHGCMVRGCIRQQRERCVSMEASTERPHRNVVCDLFQLNKGQSDYTGTRMPGGAWGL